MKMQLTIFLLVYSLIGNAQLITIDTFFANTSSKQFFKQNTLVEKISFSNYADGSKHIDVYRKGIWQADSYNYSIPNSYESYDLNFIGDNYFFQKKYGTIRFPDREIDSLSKNKCSEFPYVRGIIYPDSIRCKIEFQCPVEIKNDSDEIVFTKVEVPWGYEGGVKALQQKIQSAYQNKYVKSQHSSADSAFLFSILVDSKSSCLLRIELTQGNYSSFAQFFIDELRTACQWKPNLQGGRAVRSFTKVFVRLNKNQTITVAMPNEE
ncbi:hypothetical protein ESA94_14825 [Lacibacter luteus]|uniref:Uncharacterized protein n=1 Tax=Lacibacter luteus TaxID=2508719 RepID=A0A4V1M7D9_9BACT|nr:hypothetical protein [Lacibacter luteus]RXK59404.1 hypothetical protein ESA94_14825 [Lacibacter luteus]